AINSLTLSPALAAKLLRPHGAPKDRLARIIDVALGWLFRPFNRLFGRVAERYQRSVRRSLGRRVAVFAIYAGLLAGTVVLFQSVPGGFIPTQDKLYLFSGSKLPEGASLARTAAVTRRMGEIARSVEGVDFVQAYAGFNALQFVNTPNTTTSYILLKPFEERRRSAAEINA